MRLKKIEVLGFKSFADRQLVIVDDHVTGVIGPNGCGKSNIVDAIRWCMGEQSAKHLRGTGMADVIFAGCSSRGPAGMAEVTLTFENQGELGIPNFDQPEIALTRRLYADGTSEYSINQVPARLRDITELLMGTGAGTRGYSIIEQGQVGRIVSSKPEDRRHVIDEAAGITRFKAQKAAAERKIEATQQNLHRVSDVVAELETRLAVLRRQAQKAERYKRYRAELRDLELWTASHKYLELRATGAVLEERHQALEARLQELSVALESRETKSESLRGEVVQTEGELAERQQAVYAMDERIRWLAAENEYRVREREGLVQRSSQTATEIEVGLRNLADLERELETLAKERSLLGDGAQSGVAVEGLAAEHADYERQVAAARGRSEQASKRAGHETSSIARNEARCQSLEESMSRGRERLAVLEVERETLVARRDDLAGKIEELDRLAEAAQGELARVQDARKALDERRSTLKNEVSAAEVALDTQRSEVHRHRSRLQSLEEIQSRYRGCRSGVQFVMERQQELATSVSVDGSGAMISTPGPVYGILADYLQTPELLEPAVSAVLGDRLEGVVVDAPAVAARGVELLKREQEGRTTFLPRRSREQTRDRSDRETEMTKRGGVIGWSAPNAAAVDRNSLGSPFEVVDLSDENLVDVLTRVGDEPRAHADELLDKPGVVGRLVDLVELSGDLSRLRESLFGDVIVVDGLSTALALWEDHAVDATLVTLDGDRIEPSGVVVGGAAAPVDSALLQQKREIRELGEILVELERDFAVTRERHQQLATALHEVEQARERGGAESMDAQKRLIEARGAVGQRRTDLQRVEHETAKNQQSRQTIEAELTRHAAEIEQKMAELEVARTSVAEFEQVVAQSRDEIVQLVEARDRSAQALTEAKVAFARWQQQADALTHGQERLKRQTVGERQRIGRLQETVTSARQRIEVIDHDTEAATTERSELIERSRHATAEVHDSRERFERLRAELDELEISTRLLRRDVDERRKEHTTAELGLREIDLERQHVTSDTRERFDVDVREVLVDFHDRPLFRDAEAARHKELKQILSRMGEVNLTAIEECDEVAKRFDYLSEQRKDLEQGIAQLQEAIDRINKTTRDLFKQTFEAIDTQFQQLFPRLFGGGEARLKLTDPSDLLATGVEIEARPPGKQPRTLDLLSGGEKALTAVSLIFAIFLIKPSPFCLLDEVDAPLDDANVSRFCGLVRELSSQTQFIMITHNKVSMETADRLYGVTMEQRGVSKLVSVNLRRAVELAYN